MILHGGMEKVTLKKGTAETTGKIGLSFLWHGMEHFGVQEVIKRHIPVKGISNREIPASEKIMAGVLSIAGGSTRIEDIEVLRSDRGLLSSIGRTSMVSPDTMREFMKERRHAAGMRKANVSLGLRLMRESEVEGFTYDNDATYFDSEKDSAAYSYQEKKQYSGLLGFIAELGYCVTAGYRPGNISPQTGIENQLRKVVMYARKAGKRIASFRSDSAAHKEVIFRYCRENDIDYYISLDKNAAVMECIKTLKERAWQIQENAERQTWWAETVYVTNGGETARMLVLRWKNPRPDLFEGHYCYHAIGTNNETIEPMAWLAFHNGRMNSENYNKELKDGFNGGYAPSHDFVMNESYFLLNVLAYNMVQILKIVYLCADMVKATIKTLRLWFLNVCGQIVLTGRRYYCKILNATDETYELFKRCLGRMKTVI